MTTDAALKTATRCKRCGASLTLEEMHYYEREDGSATCNACEAAWSDQVDAWRRGISATMPEMD